MSNRVMRTSSRQVDSMHTIAQLHHVDGGADNFLCFHPEAECICR